MFKEPLVSTSNVVVYENESIGKIRTIIRDGEPWFIAKDVCEILGLTNVSEALTALENNEKKDISGSDVGYNISKLRIVSESGLYSLIFKSRKAEAKVFQKWVTSEILPTIRKTGSYSIQPQFQIPTTLSEALRLAADLAEDKARLELENKALTPKAESFDSFMAGENTHLIGVVAKALGTGQNKLFQFLRDKKILIDSGDKYNTPYQQYIDAGYFEVIYRSVERGTHKKNHAVTKVTAKGVDFISKQLKTKTAITAK